MLARSDGGCAVPGMMDEEVGVIIAGRGTGGLLCAGMDRREEARYLAYRVDAKLVSYSVVQRVASLPACFAPFNTAEPHCVCIVCSCQQVYHVCL